MHDVRQSFSQRAAATAVELLLLGDTRWRDVAHPDFFLPACVPHLALLRANIYIILGIHLALIAVRMSSRAHQSDNTQPLTEAQAGNPPIQYPREANLYKYGALASGIHEKIGELGFFRDTLAIPSRYPRDTQNLHSKPMDHSATRRPLPSAMFTRKRPRAEAQPEVAVVEVRHVWESDGSSGRWD